MYLYFSTFYIRSAGIKDNLVLEISSVSLCIVISLVLARIGWHGTLVDLLIRIWQDRD